MIIAHDGTRYWHVINSNGRFPAAFVMSDETAKSCLHDAAPYPWPQLMEMLDSAAEPVVDTYAVPDPDHGAIVHMDGEDGTDVALSERWRSDVFALDAFSHWRLGSEWAVAFDAQDNPIAIVMGMREMT